MIRKETENEPPKNAKASTILSEMERKINLIPFFMGSAGTKHLISHIKKGIVIQCLSQLI